VTAGVFVTGTDTGVGKSLAACALIHALAAAGAKPVPMKPIAAGATSVDGRLANDDTRALMAAAGLDGSWTEAVTPILLSEPMAPHIAAAREGRTIGLGPVRDALLRLRGAGDFLVVEGVGGFHVPLGDALDTMDLAKLIALPVVLVVGLRLGCLNHALLTAEAIRHSGLPLAGWIANAIDPAMAVREENVTALRTRLHAPLLGRLPYSAAPDARALAAFLDVRPLLRVPLSRP
jgi:dethiobiotin synthetase